MDPGMAFGTAEHATTRGCLRLLDARVRAGDRVADVGTGSGILAIGSALLGAASVLGIEMDEWSCAVARENAEKNGVADRIRVLRCEVDDRFVPGEPPFDGIVANIESGTLLRLLPGFRAGLREGGFLILSGILHPEAGSISDRASGCGFASDGEDREGEWWSGAFRAAPAAAPPRAR
jgi:ribosomal protein L11 methyltransferase